MYWRLMPLDDTRSWAKRMAGLMRLGEDDSLPGKTIVITRGKAIKDGCITSGARASGGFVETLPVSGWTRYPSRLIDIWRHEEAPHVICDIRAEERDDIEIMKMSIALYPFYQDVIESGGLPIHAGLVNKDGNGIAFAARGGTGKTTTCRRLSPEWPEICDDLFMAIPGADGQFFTYPFPTWSEHVWHGSTRTWDVSKSLPLGGIFYINRSDHNEVKELHPEEKSLFIYYSAIQVCDVLLSTLPAEKAKLTKVKIRDNARHIASKVPVYSLHVSLDGDVRSPIGNILDKR